MFDFSLKNQFLKWFNSIQASTLTEAMSPPSTPIKQRQTKVNVIQSELNVLESAAKSMNLLKFKIFSLF